MSTAAASPTVVDTKTAAHRELKFASMDEVKAELDRIEAAVDAGTAGTTGNWTAGQNFDHCARFMRACLDGFDGNAPWIVRKIAQMFLKKGALDPAKKLPAGFKLPKAASSMLPEEGIDDGEGLRRLREQIARLDAGEKMTHPSPLLGPLTHEEWLVLHRKHFALHLGFITV
ncbi:MAG: DUF1569 domain-containing protein [Planctomycetota bacterium]